MIDWDDEAGHFRIHWARLADPARHAIAHAVELQQARVLDVGCGNGDFCALALERGAQVSGIDAAPAMIATAKERAPDADLRVGEMDALPYADGAFDLVTGFNSLQFSDDPVTALREWMRVGRTVAVCAWAERERCEVDVVEAELRALGGATPGKPFGPRLEAVAREAGLTVATAADDRGPVRARRPERARRGLPARRARLRHARSDRGDRLARGDHRRRGALPPRRRLLPLRERVPLHHRPASVEPDSSSDLRSERIQGQPPPAPWASCPPATRSATDGAPSSSCTTVSLVTPGSVSVSS